VENMEGMFYGAQSFNSKIPQKFTSNLDIITFP
jgi:hypothetical protein